ncbi:lipid-A-disaccharide synthase [Calothrix sp. PCC 6303]|uniref:lipid-A-disaccharide synthase n=1 Tax=Calothrix sp. PCC 6303 TaxID=1170562 RepID=UPI0002A00DD6|nr:lipid-A-disaccharide synthase [Calothrix sp. PCC 6303]AFZ04288.1 lipid-A-disaccharide synthase [Calothrix sp. PCC 6303]
MRIFISTGEVSGDLQGSLLVTALKRQAAIANRELEIVALGGEQMAVAGATLLGNTAGIGSLGLLEVLPYVVPTYKLQHQAFAFLKQNPPDAVVLIDYMGPNLAIAKFIRRHLPETPIFYYIAPQAWAASLKIITSQTTREVVKVSDKLLAIFPEEARYYREHGANVTWVGHPLIDRISEFPTREAARANLGIGEGDICVALLPASRQQELNFLLPTIFATAKEIQLKLPQVHFWIPLSLDKFRDAIAQSIQAYNLNATIVSGQNKDVLAAADLAITKCGTVNLELALLNVPQVVLYKLSKLSYWIAQNILQLSLPFASPPNLVMMQPIVPEFIQETATPENLTQAAMELLLNPERKQKIQADYREMRQALGENGVCDRAAKEILTSK